MANSPRSHLRSAAQRYRNAKQGMEAARAYPNRSSAYRHAANELRDARTELHQATIAAVHAGDSQAEAARIAGLSTAQVCRLMRGSASGNNPPPPAQTVLLADTLPVLEIVNRYRKGETARQLADVYGCCDNTISRLLEQHGVPRRGNRLSLPVSNEELARRYLEDRAEVQELAAEYGASGYLISDRLRQAGVRVPVGKRRLDLPDEEIVARWKRGESISGLASAYGVSSPTIARRVRGLRRQR